MANQYTYQVVRDTTEKAVIKLTANFDGTGQESNNYRITANSLYGALDANGVPLRSSLSVSNTALPYYGLSISRLGYNVASQQKGYVELTWTAANTAQSVPIFNMDLCGKYGEDEGLVTLQNNLVAPAVPTGDIGVFTYGLVANCAYTIFVELRKDNAQYSRGQFQDPAAFNYKPFGVTP
jgi:hypothetical protein